MKLIFFDIDGTLIDEKGNMAKSTPEAIAKARENGHLCIVNTGRTASLVMDWLPKLADFDGYLCGCGTHLIFDGKDLLHKSFTAGQSKKIIEGLEKYKIDAILEGAENDYHNDPEKMYTAVFKDYITSRYKQYHWGSYQDAIGKFDKFYCYANDSKSVYRFMDEMSDLLELIDRGKGFFEIVPTGYSKASAMDRLAKYLNQSGKYPVKITREDYAAIGDSTNDLSMLSHAGTAIAMGRSAQEVLRIADYVTTDVMNDGIEKALEFLGVLKNSEK